MKQNRVISGAVAALVLAALLAEQESVCATLEGLRAQDKTRTATYQQLTARKLALKSMLGAFEEQGLL